MCLFVDKKECQIAEEDITCYKRLTIYPRFDGEWERRTPYLCMYVSDEVLLGREPFYASEPFPENAEYDAFKEEGTVKEGAIHTYTTKPFPFLIHRGEECYECIIPKGTKYYIGRDGSYFSGYASEKIIFKRKC